MMFNLFNKKKKPSPIQEQWNELGRKYATEVNEMVEFGEANGWSEWKGGDPEDNREHLADAIFTKLKEANKKGTVEAFRNDFPPAHSPLVKFFEEKGQNIEQLSFIDDEKIVFMIGAAYQDRQAYLLKGDQAIALDASIRAVGKSKRNNVFAIATEGKIVTTQGWEGPIIHTFGLDDTKSCGITELMPFNDGKKLLLVTQEGIYIISAQGENMVHPVEDPDDEEWEAYIDMDNATLSNDNKYIVVGDQGSDHRVLDANGVEIGQIGPQSSYPHFCLFSADDQQLITNSCHFYNGITIAVDTAGLNGLQIDAYEESEHYKTINEEMRVYAGLATKSFYILGDAYGYIKAFDKTGQCVWRHFLGSTIGGMTISDDESTLWVAACTGIIHKLKLGQGHRDTHTIGNGDHYEEMRMIFWKDEPIMKW